MFYVSMGCRILRLDAIAFLWKKIGTSCLHLPETHEVVKLIRNLLEVVAPDVLILTETNVPHEENVSYFGKGNEAHAVYQFTLPPLLLHGLLSGTAEHLTSWAAQLSLPPKGCHFLNFTASHDGIGVRPLEGILPKDEILGMADQIRKKGGFVSMRKLEDGTEAPYELNCTYFSALSDQEDVALGETRFQCSQAVALAMRGIPAVYFHSLCGTSNFLEGVEQTGRSRTINRKKWDSSELNNLLQEKDGQSVRVFEWYTRVLRRRAACSAFHPEAAQVIKDFGSSVFALERISLDGNLTVLCLFNFSDKDTEVCDSKEMKSYFPALLFFLIGLLIGTSATIFGIFLGVIFSMYVENLRQFISTVFNLRLFPEEIYFLSTMPSEINIFSIFIISICSIFVTITVSIFPALKAAKLDPIKALKYE